MTQDLAEGGIEHGPMTIGQLFAGDAPITTNHSVCATDVDKYEVVLITAAGLDNDLTGITDGAKCVIAAQPALTGQDCPYYSGGHFNHAALVWPVALDTLAKRQEFFAGTPIMIGSISN
jgi:hypothetical protein